MDSARSIERGNMNREHQERIQVLTLEIEDTLEPSDLISVLFSRYIIDKDDKELIEAEKSRKGRVKVLLDILVNRGPNSFQAFVSALWGKGYSSLVRKLSYEENVTNVIWQQNLADKITVLSMKAEAIKDFVDEKVAKLENEISTKITSLVEAFNRLEVMSADINKKQGQENEDLKRQLQEKEELLQDTFKKVRELEDTIENLLKENASLRDHIQKLETESSRQASEITTMKKEIDEEKQKAKVTKKESEERFLKIEQEMERGKVEREALKQSQEDKKKNTEMDLSVSLSENLSIIHRSKTHLTVSKKVLTPRK